MAAAMAMAMATLTATMATAMATATASHGLREPATACVSLRQPASACDSLRQPATSTVGDCVLAQLRLAGMVLYPALRCWIEYMISLGPEATACNDGPSAAPSTVPSHTGTEA